MRLIKLDEDMEGLWYFKWVLLTLKPEEKELEDNWGELHDRVECVTLAVIENIFGV